MRDLGNIVAYPIEDFIGVADDELHPHIGIIRFISAVRLILQQLHCVANARHHIPRAAWRAFPQVLKNSFAIRERFRGVPNPHRSWRLSASATTSSDTNSPRSACANPLRTAARSSSLMMYTPVRRACISRAYSVNSS